MPPTLEPTNTPATPGQQPLLNAPLTPGTDPTASPYQSPQAYTSLPPQDAPPKKSKKRLLLIIGVVLLAIALAIGIVFLVRSFTNKSSSQNSNLPYVFAEPMLDVESNKSFTFPFEVPEAVVKKYAPTGDYSEFMQLFVDPGLQTLAPEADVYGTTVMKEFYIKPQRPTRFTDIRDLDAGYTEVRPYQDRHWTFSNEYYIVQKRDFKTGEKLAKPIITKFTIKDASSKPSATFNVDDKGFGNFQWSAVAGAKEYYIFRYQDDDVRRAEIIGKTTKTTWSTTEEIQTKLSKQISSTTDSTYSQNHHFRTFNYSDDDLRRQNTLTDPLTKEDQKITDYQFGVIAKLAKSASPASFVDRKAIVSQLPVAIASEANKEIAPSRTVATLNDLPTHLAVTMADGKSVKRMLVPNLDKTKEEQLLVDEVVAGKIRSSTLTVLRIHYSLEGTALSTSFSVKNYDPKTISQEIQRVATRNKEAQVTTGASGSYTYTTPIGGTPRQISKEAPKVDYPVYGSSELVRYLAANMIAGSEYIDVSKFVKQGLGSSMEDAIKEAQYQNTYTLFRGITRFDPKKNLVQVEYTIGDKKARQEEQAAIAKKVKEVTAAIIKPGMSERQKAVAIDKYLIDTVTYNYDALEVIDSYEGSFLKSAYTAALQRTWTPAGPLIDKTAVCGGYAMAFKALADEAGLESVYVTGFVNGQLHAWNKVKVDGKWRIVDSTWNDTPARDKAYLLITDAQAGKLREQTQDNNFMNDLLVAQYATN